ncbi:MAG: hypothetical protein WC834_00190 [Eubacteriales bacterium]
MNDVKRDYNELLAREKKAEGYLDNPDILLGKRENWLPEFQKILNGLNECLMKIGDYTSDEVLNGFKIKTGGANND